jgi:hypothetical protein
MPISSISVAEATTSRSAAPNERHRCRTNWRRQNLRPLPAPRNPRRRRDCHFVYGGPVREAECLRCCRPNCSPSASSRQRRPLLATTVARARLRLQDASAGLVGNAQRCSQRPPSKATPRPRRQNVRVDPSLPRARSERGKRRRRAATSDAAGRSRDASAATAIIPGTHRRCAASRVLRERHGARRA